MQIARHSGKDRKERRTKKEGKSKKKKKFIKKGSYFTRIWELRGKVKGKARAGETSVGPGQVLVPFLFTWTSLSERKK